MDNDLDYLLNEAFSFDLELNPHSIYFERVEDYFGAEDDDCWISEEGKAEAILSQKVVLGRVYPDGSVTSHVVLGADIASVVSECATICRRERARYLSARARHD